MFGFQKVLKKGKKNLRKIFNFVIKIQKKIKYN